MGYLEQATADATEQSTTIPEQVLPNLYGKSKVLPESKQITRAAGFPFQALRAARSGLGANLDQPEVANPSPVGQKYLSKAYKGIDC